MITRSHHKLSAKRIWVIAAVIALTLLLVGCAVVYVLSLRDMKIGEYTITKQEHYGPNWEVIEETQITYDVLSVQSFSDSPNQQATREWQAYVDSFDTYDPLEIPDEVRLSVPDSYSNYGCWSPEMMVKLDEIAQKYGLKLMGENIGTNQTYVTVLLDAFKLPELLRKQPYADAQIRSAGIYQHGSCHLEVDILLDERFDWPYYIFADLHYSAKGYFDPYTIRIRDLDTVQEWEYTLSNGGTALLALDEETALILVEGKEGFFAIDFDAQMGIDRVTPEMMEQIADLFDFSVIPYTLKDEEWETAKANLLAAEEQHRLDYNAWIEADHQMKQKESYDEWVQQTLENGREIASLGYAFYDIDGNGSQELLIGRDGYCEAIFWEKDGTTQQFANAAVNLYVYFIYSLIDGKVSCYSLISDGTITACEDGILQATIHYGPENFTTRFYRLNRGRIELVDYLRYDVDVDAENPWFRSPDLTGQDMTLEPISEMEAKSIIASYEPLEIKMKPISEYPFA